MSKPKHLYRQVARRDDLPRWLLVESNYVPFQWWVLHDGGWTSLRAPSREEAEAFCEGLYGPAYPEK